MVATFFSGTLPGDPFFEDNDDLMVLQEALLEVYSDEEPIDYGDSPIDAGASGTALRFITAVCASTPGADYVITGTDRLMQRPMLPLIDILREAGAKIETLGDNSTGPYRVKGAQLEGGSFSIRGDISSQFISALMLVAPVWKKGMNLKFTTTLVSQPYIEMTARLMEKFGVKVNLSDTEVTVHPGHYKEPKDFRIEADWSSASFFYEAALLGAPKMTLENLPDPAQSLQGDAACSRIFSQLGVKSTFDEKGATIFDSGNHPDKITDNFRDCPDLVLPFAVGCLCSGIKFRCEGVEHLRLKESDRIESLQSEAGKLGYVVEAGNDFIEWNGERKELSEEKDTPTIDPHDDHRVAMAFAMAALRTGKIRIENPQVVEKSFIDFWNQLPGVGLHCELNGNVMTISR